jgi:hypothetical protein
MSDRNRSIEVDTFLVDLKRTDEKSYSILAHLRDIIFEMHPTSSEKLMYGGIVFFMDNEMFGGIFAYKDHVSIEFSKGYLMQDLLNRLEGKGKFRRHLKLQSELDIKVKDVAYYISRRL